MHPAFDLLHCWTVRKSVQIPQHRPTVHWVLLLGPVQEPGVAYAVPNYGKGPARKLPARCRSACDRPACLNPALLIVNIFVLTGDIGGRGHRKGRAEWGEWPQEPEGWRRANLQIRGEEQERRREDKWRASVGEEDDGDCSGEDGPGKRETGTT